MAQDAVNHRVYQSSTMTASVAPHRSLKKTAFYAWSISFKCTLLVQKQRRKRSRLLLCLLLHTTNWPRFSTLESRYGSALCANGSELTHFRSILTAWQASEGDNRDNAFAIIIIKRSFSSICPKILLFQKEFSLALFLLSSNPLLKRLKDFSWIHGFDSLSNYFFMPLWFIKTRLKLESFNL